MSRIRRSKRCPQGRGAVGARFVFSKRPGLPMVALAILIAAGFPVRASEMHVDGGDLVLDGLLAADLLAIGPSSTLRGGGTVEGSIAVAGAIAPGLSEAVASSQTVSGTATFLTGSQFRCDVAGHSALDRLCVGGTVAGDCAVVASAAVGAYPVNEILVQGAPGSDFGGFFSLDPYTWRMDVTGNLALALTHLRGDSDSDGMPDWWEMAHFTHNRTNATPEGNADGDSSPNGDEYVANTDPDDFFSCFRITDLQQALAPTSRVTWASAPGRRYTVLQFTNLLAGDRITSAVITVYAQPEAAWTNLTVPQRTGFIAIRVQENIP